MALRMVYENVSFQEDNGKERFGYRVICRLYYTLNCIISVESLTFLHFLKYPLWHVRIINKSDRLADNT